MKEKKKSDIAILLGYAGNYKEMLAAEMDTSPAVIKRDMEFLERMGMIRKIDFAGADGMKSACSECGGCGGKKKCASCMPGGGFENMGVMWEVVSAVRN